MLGFDIPTFVFQIINFLILLAILARFFYRPVLDVMQQRQEQIDARIEDAEERARQADEERSEAGPAVRDRGARGSRAAGVGPQMTRPRSASGCWRRPRPRRRAHRGGAQARPRPRRRQRCERVEPASLPVGREHRRRR